ncbi:hypothetical protein ACHAW5_001165 [Stephanodiscus triporus]|uniref:STI1 domain-containing protein n=1 Tax=Stephanodiscus triporus TaxID=2934178 RepID=A0ABD3MUG6_9STRA
MVSRTIKSVSLWSLAILGLVMPTPSTAQFGVGANRRKGGAAASFEELNKMAAEHMAVEGKKGVAGGGMDLKNMDLGALMKDFDPAMLQELLAEGMNDPAVQEMFSGMQGAMKELLNMDPDQLKVQMEQAMEMLTSIDMRENIINQKEEVLAMMEAQGTATPEEIAEFRADPAKFEEAMTKAFGQMKEIFSDPQAMDTVVQMMQGFGAIMKDPQAALSKLGGVLQEVLADDDKIEEARLQLLNDPSVAGNNVLKDMFRTEEMQAILNDPVKWRKSVKEGQKMLSDEDDGPSGGLGMGEL